MLVVLSWLGTPVRLEYEYLIFENNCRNDEPRGPTTILGSTMLEITSSFL